MLLLEYDKNRFYAKKALTPIAGPTLIQKAAMGVVSQVCAIFRADPPKMLILDEYWYYHQACLNHRNKNKPVAF